jgi:hypothetical protein
VGGGTLKQLYKYRNPFVADGSPSKVGQCWESGSGSGANSQRYGSRSGSSPAPDPSLSQKCVKRTEIMPANKILTLNLIF